MLVANDIEAHADLHDSAVGKAMIPATCVGTWTGIRSPLRGSLVTTRSLRGLVARPATLATGPSRLTRSVMLNAAPCPASDRRRLHNRTQDLDASAHLARAHERCGAADQDR